jgi:hypothetical protein
MWWWVQNSLNGMDKRLDSVPTKSKVSEGYHIDNELDHARLLTYTSQRRLICVGKDGNQRWQRSIWVSQASSNQPSTGSPSFFSLDRLTAHANGNRRASRRGRGTTTTITTTSTRRWRTGEPNPSNKRPMKLRDAIWRTTFSCQCESSFFQHDVSIQQ